MGEDLYRASAVAFATTAMKAIENVAKQCAEADGRARAWTKAKKDHPVQGYCNG
jgi:hypothetical protein